MYPDKDILPLRLHVFILFDLIFLFSYFFDPYTLLFCRDAQFKVSNYSSLGYLFVTINSANSAIVQLRCDYITATLHCPWQNLAKHNDGWRDKIVSIGHSPRWHELGFTANFVCQDPPTAAERGLRARFESVLGRLF